MQGCNFFRTAGEAILDAQRYFSHQFTIIFFRAPGEAILDAQRYFSKTLRDTFAT